jgi:uncharacterized protein YajQ (UPF0234 family)
MASTFSFDIVSDYDVAEMNNAIDQTLRELSSRYDFKGTSANLQFRDGDKTGLKITGDNEYHIEAILDIVRKKLASRGISQKVLDTSKDPVTSNLRVTQDVAFKKGLSQDNAKKINAVIREHYPKVKAQIQGTEIRVSSAKKDELQSVMQLLQKQEFDFPLSFTNYR